MEFYILPWQQWHGRQSGCNSKPHRGGEAPLISSPPQHAECWWCRQILQYGMLWQESILHTNPSHAGAESGCGTHLLRTQALTKLALALVACAALLRQPAAVAP
jgi:hypothetical protein